MKFIGEPGLYVKISRPQYGEVKGFHFDSNGIYESNHPTTIKRLMANFKVYEKQQEETQQEQVKEVKHRQKRETKPQKRGRKQ